MKRLLLFGLIFLSLILLPQIAKAENLESANFAISNDELMVGSLDGESSNFSVIGENSPLVGSLESDNFSQEGVLLGESIPSPTPSSDSDSSSDSSSDSDSSSTTTSTFLSRVTDFFRQLLDSPSQLFDISLELDDTTIANIKELVARVIFTSFGTEPTPVDLTFIILNEVGEGLYQSRDSTIVETELVFKKYFSDVETIFEDGKYTLVLKTLYNTDVEDEFRAEFTIGEKAGFNWKLYLPILFVIFIFLFLLWKKRKKDKDNKTPKLQRKSKKRK